MSLITKVAATAFFLVKKVVAALLLSILFVALAWSVNQIGFSMKAVVPLVIVMLGIYILDQFLAERKRNKLAEANATPADTPIATVDETDEESVSPSSTT